MGDPGPSDVDNLALPDNVEVYVPQDDADSRKAREWAQGQGNFVVTSQHTAVAGPPNCQLLAQPIYYARHLEHPRNYAGNLRLSIPQSRVFSRPGGPSSTWYQDSEGVWHQVPDNYPTSGH